MFVVDETPDNQFIITVSMSILETIGMQKGSFSVLGARVLGIDYLSYLKLNLQYGATVIGGGRYPFVYYNDRNKARRFCNLLNQRLSSISFVQEENR